MGAIINDNKFVISTEPKTIYFDFPKDIDNDLKHEIYFIVKLNESLEEETIKNQII